MTTTETVTEKTAAQKKRDYMREWQRQSREKKRTAREEIYKLRTCQSISVLESAAAWKGGFPHVENIKYPLNEIVDTTAYDRFRYRPVIQCICNQEMRYGIGSDGQEVLMCPTIECERFNIEYELPPVSLKKKETKIAS